MRAESQRRKRNPVIVTACRQENITHVQAILEVSPEATTWSAASLTDLLERHSSYFFLGWQREEIAGFIVGRRVHDEGEILNLAVKPQFRRRGIANALVKALLEVFARESVLKVFLEVRESNPAAIASYEGLGFREVGRREGYYREPDESALVLALALKDSPQHGTR